MIGPLAWTALQLLLALFWSFAAFPPIARGRQAITWLVWIAVGATLCRLWIR